MSYVFYLFRPQPGDDPLKTVQAMFPPHQKPAQHSMNPLKHDPQEAPKAPTGVVDPDLDDPETLLEGQIEEGDKIRDGLAKMKFDLSQLLTSRNPELQYPEAVQIAVQVGTSLESACRPFRELSLRAAATNEVRIDLFDFGARISIPFAIIGDEVRQIFGEVWEYIHLLKRANDYLAYDPQLGRMIKNTADMILAMTGYEYLYSEHLRAESKAKGLLPEDADEYLPDDATQPLRESHIDSPGVNEIETPPPSNITPNPSAVAAASAAVSSVSRPQPQSPADDPSLAAPRKKKWLFW